MNAKVQSAIVANIIGATVAFGFSWLYFRADLEAVFNPVLTNVKTEYVSREGGILHFKVEFTKARDAIGILNSWNMDADVIREGGEMFFTPETCAGNLLASGASPTGSTQKRDMCVTIPKSLDGRPFAVSGLIIYKLTSGFTVPARFPRFNVPGS
jgi:hypothetical protein